MASPTTSPEASGVSSPGAGAWGVGDFLVETLLPEAFVFADIVRLYVDSPRGMATVY